MVKDEVPAAMPCDSLVEVGDGVSGANIHPFTRSLIWLLA